jgi:hypothetical protein
MKPKWIYALVIFFLSSCVPMDTPTSTKTILPAGFYTSVPSSISTHALPPTSSFSPTPAAGTPLPTQLTVVPTLNPAQVIQHEEIKRIIKEYFEIHYQVLSISPPIDFQENSFGDLVSDSPDAKDFLITEMAKLDLESKYYELNKLRYAEYNYSLNYHSIIVDDTTGLADVSLYDIFEVIHERSVEANPEDPLVSLGGLSHQIL